jgi:hypothetical protein
MLQIAHLDDALNTTCICYLFLDLGIDEFYVKNNALNFNSFVQ